MLADHKLNSLTGEIIAAAIEVHRTLGPGLLESTYKICLHYELSLRNIRFVAEHSMPLVYKQIAIESAYRADLLVEDAVVVELKSAHQVAPVHKAQILTYMRLASCPLGLIINFNVTKLTDGVARLILPRTPPRR
jgi:GxxExxY protein